MRELSFEVNLNEGSEIFYLINALKELQILNVLEFRSRGFLLLCRGTRELSLLFRKNILKADDSHHIRVRTLSQHGKDSGHELMLVSGRWLIHEKTGKKERDTRHAAELRFFKAMEKAPLYNLENPRFQNGKLRVSVIAHDKEIRRLLDGLDEIRVPYKILRLGIPKVATNSTLGALTTKQMNMLKLAHAMGYYEVPKRTTTDELAGIMHMDKGTVGEHLRRAEKNVFDRLLA